MSKIEALCATVGFILLCSCAGPGAETSYVFPDRDLDDPLYEDWTLIVEDSASIAVLEQRLQQIPPADGGPGDPTDQQISCEGDVCSLRDEICDLSVRICDIAARHPDAEDMAWYCEDASRRCERADSEVVETCQCQQWDPQLMTEQWDVPLISRDILFGNPTRRSPNISPDGTQLAYLAPEEGVMNVWVRTAGAEDDRALTHDRGRGIEGYLWAYNGEQIVYVQDRDGDENWRVYAVSADGGEPVELTPDVGVQARITGISPDFPDEILVSLNDRDPEYHDLYRLNLRSGERTLLALNDISAGLFRTDNDWVVRVAMVPTPEGGFEVLHRSSVDDAWSELLNIPSDDALTTVPLVFASDNQTLYFWSSIGANTAELRTLDTLTGEEEVIATDPIYDVEHVFVHPVTHEIQAVGYERERTEWVVLDETIRADFEALSALNEGDLIPINRDLSDRVWLASFVMDVGGAQYYAFDRESGEGTFLFTAIPELEGLQLAPMLPISYEARDGLTIYGYLTLPVGLESDNLPAVVLVHGGPWSRNYWSYHPFAQWLANRGYAVLQPNFRGSTGYGKAFTNAGDREWGLAMQDDISDGVHWLIDQGYADPERVAIFGGSYGGYSVLSGLTTTPGLYACGVDIVGPSNLITLLEAIPPYWASIRDLMYRRVGDPIVDAEFLRSISPLFHAEEIQAPLLIGQGANDPRVAQEESEQIVAAMQAHNLPVTYVLYPDEGHGFVRPENRISFFAVAEAFLSQHLGGRFEPIEDDFEGSSITVPDGDTYVPGLSETLAGHRGGDDL